MGHEDAIVIDVDCEPKGQPRPRAVVGKNGRARVYDAGTAEGFKSMIATAIGPKLPREPWSGPVALSVYCRMPRPKGHYGTGRNADRLKDGAPDWHTKKPDGDNLLKAVKDILTSCGLWRDDSQVVASMLVKRYCIRNERPGVLINAEPWDGERVVDTLLAESAYGRGTVTIEDQRVEMKG